MFNKDLCKKFKSTYWFCDVILTNSVSCCGKVLIRMSTKIARKDKMSISIRVGFYRDLEIERITYSDYKHVQRVRENISL